MGKGLIFLTHTEKANIMATDKLFTVCGTSKLDGEMKVRFANDTMRIKVLAKHGHDDITLVELPSVRLSRARLLTILIARTTSPLRQPKPPLAPLLARRKKLLLKQRAKLRTKTHHSGLLKLLLAKL